MARAKPKFTVLDVQRAMAGAKRAGFEVARCDVAPDGTISVVTIAGAQLSKSGAVGRQSALARWQAEEDAFAAASLRDGGRASENWD